jgi:hypothetical protein
MAPVAPSHSVIVANVTYELKSRLQGPCYVGSEAGFKGPDRDDTFYEADLVISCTPVASGMAAIPDPRRRDRGAFAVDDRARSRT